MVLSLVLMATACKGAEEASQEKNTTDDPSGEKESPDPSRAKVGDVTVQITDYNPVNKKIYEVGENVKLNFDPNGVYIL